MMKRKYEEISNIDTLHELGYEIYKNKINIPDNVLNYISKKANKSMLTIFNHNEHKKKK